MGFTILSNIKPWTEDILTFLVNLKEKKSQKFLSKLGQLKLSHWVMKNILCDKNTRHVLLDLHLQVFCKEAQKEYTQKWENGKMIVGWPGPTNMYPDFLVYH